MPAMEHALIERFETAMRFGDVPAARRIHMRLVALIYRRQGEPFNIQRANDTFRFLASLYGVGVE